MTSLSEVEDVPAETVHGGHGEAGGCMTDHE